jgi:hypothetical protein
MRAASGKREHSMSVGFRAVQWNRAKLVYAVGARILLLPGATVTIEAAKTYYHSPAYSIASR